LVAVAFAYGLVIVAFAYSYGHISGTNINPAVTFGMFVSGNMKIWEAVDYWIAQFLGGLSGAGMLFVVLGGSESGLGPTVLRAHSALPFIQTPSDSSGYTRSALSLGRLWQRRSFATF